MTFTLTFTAALIILAPLLLICMWADAVDSRKDKRR